jgi:hypothetical protein
MNGIWEISSCTADHGKKAGAGNNAAPDSGSAPVQGLHCFGTSKSTGGTWIWPGIALGQMRPGLRKILLDRLNASDDGQDGLYAVVARQGRGLFFYLTRLAGRVANIMENYSQGQPIRPRLKYVGRNPTETDGFR